MRDITIIFPPLRVSRDFIDYPYFADLGAATVPDLVSWEWAKDRRGGKAPRQRAGDLAAEAQFAVLRHQFDAGLAVPQGLRDLGGIVSDRGDDTEAGNDDAFHVSSLRRHLAHRP